MFGSKKGQNSKSQVAVNIETMEGNLKGEGGKVMNVEYDVNNVEQDPIKSNVTQNPVENVPSIVKKEQVFKEPFISEGAASPKNETVGKGTFNAVLDEKVGQVQKKEEKIMPIEVPQNNDSAFLHQAVDEKIDNKNNNSINKIDYNKISKPKGGGSKAFLFIILFIILLAGILLGGYYFYMNKKDPGQQLEKDKPAVKKVEKPVVNKDEPIQEPVVKEEVRAVKKVEEMITTEGTFNQDIKKFIVDLKQRRSAVDLRNGVFISPMLTSEKNMSASDLLKALHLTEFFNSEDLKEGCKLFAIEDSGNIRIAVIFELTEVADDKVIKNRIIQDEKELMPKMSYLFVDGLKPVVPAEVHFAVNEDNMKARFANYVPGIETSSVDWNVLDLGKGKLLYLATSRQTARALTEHFMRMVIK